MPRDQKSSREKKYAQNLAGEAAAGRVAERTGAEFGNLKTAFKKLLSDYEKIKKLPAETVLEHKSAQWLCDNFHLVEKEYRGVLIEQKQRTKGYYGYIFEEGRKKLLSLFVADGINHYYNNLPGEEEIFRFLKAFTEVLPLKDSQLLCIPAALRASLIYKICEQSEKILADLKAGREAKEREALLISNAVKGLRFLSEWDFSDTFESLSRVENILKSDPAGLYAICSKETKAAYRHAIEKKAREENVDEAAFALGVIEFCRMQTEERRRHVGWVLLLAELEERKIPDHRAYSISIAALTALISLWVGFLTGRVIAALLVFFPLLDIAKRTLDFILSKTLPHRIVPAYDEDCEEVKSQRVLCVISALITSEKKVPELFSKLEEYYLGGGEGDILFGILGDLKDADKESLSGDGAIIEAAKKEVERLNQKYKTDRFAFFLRERQYNEKQGKYMSYERKRGAILELCALIAGEIDLSFSVVEGNLKKIVERDYLLTLDADTQPGLDNIGKLTAAACHILNLPVLNREGTAVEKGYGIIEPAVVLDIPEEKTSYFQKIFAPGRGTDTYSGSIFDVNYELFGDGIFTGKGMLDIKTFYKTARRFFPDNKILSHDLLESGVLRCAFLSEVKFFDSFPSGPIPYFERAERWIRGDVQTAPWLFKTVPNRAGKREKNPLSALTKYKIRENLRRAALPVFLLLNLVLPAFLGMEFRWLVFFIPILNLFLPVLLMIPERLFPGRIYLRSFSDVFSPFAATFSQSFVNLALLFYHASISLRAICLSLYRMLYSKKNLISWVTAAQSESRAKGTFLYHVRKLSLSEAFGALLFLRPGGWMARCLGALFFVSGGISFLLSLKRPPEKGLSPSDRGYLLSHAQRIFSYFEDFAGEENSFLPPDNFQAQPENGVAHRTSPTNIGLYLLSVICAHDLGIIPGERAAEKIERTIFTVKELAKMDGHLLNWYDTRDRHVLEPAFCSTVDSGNFICCLMALHSALREKHLAEHLLPEIEELISSADFKALYDAKKNLFYIGKQKEGEESGSHYDLLASEARQTSYIAVLRGEAPKKHWFMLGRSLSVSGGYGGLYSWTGTMFEYFMPNLLMPLYRDSLLYESLKYCAHIQKKRGRALKIPWGMSESAFFAFDPSLNYQYKAFGVQRLALKGSMGERDVISPYSSFLALITNPKDAVANLKRIEKEYGVGKYGFYEAVDFKKGGDGEVVKCFMAHHLGMSMLSIGNTLLENRLQKYFMEYGKNRAGKELLKEKVPSSAVILSGVPEKDAPKLPDRYLGERAVREAPGADYKDFSVNILGGGRYRVLLRNTGETASECSGWEPYRTGMTGLEKPGFYGFFKDERSFHSFTFAPLYEKGCDYKTLFEEYKSVFGADFARYETSLCITADQKTKAEFRSYKIRNKGREPQKLTVYFYLEPSANEKAADDAHPAFAKLFIETSYDEEKRVFVVNRRKREAESEERAFALGVWGIEKLSFETRREKILRRQGGYENIAKINPEELENKAFLSVDPALLVCGEIELAGGEEKEILLVLAAGTSREEVAERARDFSSPEAAGKNKEQQKELSRALASFFMLNSREKALAYSLCENFFLEESPYGLYYPREKGAERGQKLLWRFGISGDRKIFLLRIEADEYLKKIDIALKIFRFMIMKGILCDLVLLYAEDGDYNRPVYHKIEGKVREYSLFSLPGARDHVHILNESQMAPFEVEGILEAADIIADLDDELVFEPRRKSEKEPPVKKNAAGQNKSPAVKNTKGLLLYNGYGGFTKDGYRLLLAPGEAPPRPYAQILSNGKYGVLITEGGGGFSFCKNAGENKLTNFENDPLLDDALTDLTLFEREEGSLFASKRRADTLYEIDYRPNEAEFKSEFEEIRREVLLYVPERYSCEVRRVTLQNESRRERKVALSFKTELCCGQTRTKTAKYVKTAFDPKRKILTAAQEFYGDFRNSTTFLAVSEKEFSWTCDYDDIFAGRYNTKKDGGVNPGFAATVEILLPPGGKKEVVFLLGQYENERELSEMLKNYLEPNTVELERKKAREKIERVTGAVKIETPDTALNLIMGNLLYQAYVSRLCARTGYYQIGGGYGYRDQLQDVMALIATSPVIARNQILRSACHQFEEGDVQHWWHAIKENKSVAHKGVRTRYSDDLLWLPFVLSLYVETTDDLSILKIKVPYLRGEVLAPEEDERYFAPVYGEKWGSIFEHAQKALEKGINPSERGLIFMGGGDWNDGMNKVGAGGKGESVWLTIFGARVLRAFAALCEKIGEEEAAKGYKERAGALLRAVEEHAWAGEYYIRAFYDDGEPLGAPGSDECRIDSLPQSFMAIAGGDEARVKLALKKAYEELVDVQKRYVKLFTPPFAHSKKNPGYVKGYLPGVRENGGQYTHAAIWLAQGYFAAGEKEKGYEILDLLNPARRAGTKEGADLHRLEPYVIAADVSSNPDFDGQGGWSFYTGSAGLYHKTVIEDFLGIKKEGKMLRFSPNVPDDWQEFKVFYRTGGKELTLRFLRAGDEEKTKELSLHREDLEREIIIRF